MLAEEQEFGASVELLRTAVPDEVRAALGTVVKEAKTSWKHY